MFASPNSCIVPYTPPLKPKLDNQQNGSFVIIMVNTHLADLKQKYINIISAISNPSCSHQTLRNPFILSNLILIIFQKLQNTPKATTIPLLLHHPSIISGSLQPYFPNWKLLFQYCFQRAQPWQSEIQARASFFEPRLLHYSPLGAQGCICLSS